jgi:hypothetical protein
MVGFAIWRLFTRKAKKREERDKAQRPFNFTDQRTLPPQTELEQKIFDKMWNLRLGWNWRETALARSHGDLLLHEGAG